MAEEMALRDIDEDQQDGERLNLEEVDGMTSSHETPDNMMSSSKEPAKPISKTTVADLAVELMAVDQ